MIRILLVWLFIFLFFPADHSIYSQKLVFEKINLNPEEPIIKMAQDSDGYLYILSEKNIYHYNRYDLEKLNLNFVLENESLRDFVLFDNKLLVISNDHFRSFDAKSLNLLHQRKFSETLLFNIVTDQQYYYIYSINLKRYSIVRYDQNYAMLDTLYNAPMAVKLHFDTQDSSLWIATPDSVFHYQTSRCDKYPIDYLQIKTLSAFHVINSHQAWISSPKVGLYKVDLVHKKVLQAKLKPEFQKILMIERFGPSIYLFLSIGTHPNFMSIQDHFFNLGDYNDNFKNIYRSKFSDRQNTLWLTTTQTIYKITNSSFISMPITGPIQPPRTLSIVPLKNSLLCFTQFNAYLFKSDFRFYPLDLGENSHINDIFTIKDSLVGVCVSEKKLMVYNPKNWRLVTQVQLPDSLMGVKGFFWHDSVFLLSHNKIMIMDKNQQVKILRSWPYNEVRFSGFQIQNKKLYLSSRNPTNRGFYEVKSPDFPKIMVDHHGELIDNYRSLFQVSDDSLFYIHDSTLYLKTRDKLEELLTSNQLINVYPRMIVDEEKNLWIFSFKGLIQRDSSNNFYSYLQQDGNSDPLISNIAMIHFQGYTIFPGRNQLALMFDWNLKNKATHGLNGIRPEIKQLLVNNRNYPVTDPISLNYSENTISALLNFPDYKNNNDLAIFYKLEPIYNEWRITKGKTWFTLNDLEPGRYKLMIRVHIPYSIYQPPVREYTIIIRFPFWKTNLFYFGLVILLGSLLGGIIYIRNKQRARLAEIQQNYIHQLEITVEEKTASLKQYSLTLESLVKEKTKELYNTELKYERIIDQSQEVIFTLNYRQEIIFLNKRGRNIIGLPSEGEFLPILVQEFIPSFRLAPIIKLMETNKTLTDYRLNLTLLNRDYAFLLTLLVNDQKSSYPLYEGVLFDITRLVNFEKALTQAQKMESLGVLAGGIAHEFNNLNTVIKGFTAMLLNHVQDDKSRKHLSLIHKASLTLEKLTSQILTYARQQPSDKRIINPYEIVRDVFDLVSNFKKKDIEFVIDIHENSKEFRIEIDPYQLNQALLNLILNSVDGFDDHHTTKIIEVGQKIIVLKDELFAVDSIISIGRFLQIWIRDNGSGIPYSHQSKIFEPFFTTKPPGKGTGLGLSLVYGIVKQNNGYIRFESEPDVGTIFYLYFPTIPMKD